MKKILIANIFGIGDVLFTTPLAANLKKHFDGASIDYLCNARTRAVIECNLDIDEIFVYEKDDFVKLWKESKTRYLKGLYRLFSFIRLKQYDAVFDFTLSREFGLFFTLAGIRKRIGFDYKKRGIFLTDKVALEGFENRHVIEHYLDLLKYLGVSNSIKEMKLDPEEKAKEWVSGYLKERGLEGGELVAMCPGGGASWGEQASRKRWEAKGFSKAADILIRHGIRVIILGDSSEKHLCEEVAHNMRENTVAVETELSLKNYIALIDKCDLVLCNDGGPLHIAAALDKKTVSIFGPVNDRVYGPYPPSDKHKVIKAMELKCRPCYGRFKLPECKYENSCLTNIDPQDVANSCLSLLSR